MYFPYDLSRRTRSRHNRGNVAKFVLVFAATKSLLVTRGLNVCYRVAIGIIIPRDYKLGIARSCNAGLSGNLWSKRAAGAATETPDTRATCF
jgi:hypothetical protein